MSALKSRYPWVPTGSPPPSTDTSIPPGLRRVGEKGKAKGRGLFATCDFPAGSAIAVFNRPLIAVPDGNKVRSTCDWCLRRGISSLSHAEPPQEAHLQQPVPLQACTGCRYVYYCSKKCQTAAWKEVHKAECPWLKKSLKTVGEKEMEHITVGGNSRAVMQLLARLKRDDEVVRDAVGDVPFYGSTWKEGREGVLEGLAEEFKKEFATSEGGQVFEGLMLKAMGATEMTGFTHEDMDPREMFGEGGVVNKVMQLFCKVQINAFNTEDPDYSNPGILVDTVLSMINHSCIPNAAVRLASRTAILRALRDIKEGEEIELSYVDTTESTIERQQKLRGYHFQCKCHRCTGDLDVYQVCQQSPVIPMNFFSLQPNLEIYTKPQINRAQFKKAFPEISNGAASYSKCTERAEALLAAGMWAVHPLPEMYFNWIAEDEYGKYNLAYALCNACFQATRVVPIGCVAPFELFRVKGMLVIARLLSQTAPLSATGELAKVCSMPVLVETLARADQVSTCEAILRLVIHYGPMAHSDDWVVMESAREMLADIESLQGRERESNLLKAWVSDPNHPEGKAFFEKVVYEPVMRLSDIALLLMATRHGNADLGKRLEARLKQQTL